MFYFKKSELSVPDRNTGFYVFNTVRKLITKVGLVEMSQSILILVHGLNQTQAVDVGREVVHKKSSKYGFT